VPAGANGPATDTPAASEFILDIPQPGVSGVTDEPGLPPHRPQAKPKADPLAPTDLRSKVSSLAAAIGEHAEGGTGDPDDLHRKSIGLSDSTGHLASSAAPTLSAMVDVMSRFDAHGNALLGKAPVAAPITFGNPANKPHDWLNQGALGSFGGKAG
jgi:hypothetical protein